MSLSVLELANALKQNGSCGADLLHALRRRFRGDDSGAIAPMFGLLLIPILMLTLFGIDISRALTSRTNLQDAVDAAALALAHLPSSTSQTQLNQIANNWIKANVSDKSLGPITLTVSSSNNTVIVTASSSVVSLAGGLTNIIQIPVKTTATAKYGNNIELALVLDNTYSMNDNNKLNDLKTAATNLVNTLSTAAGGVPNALKIGVVPFSVTVNIGQGNQGYSWLSGVQPTAYGTDLFVQSNVNRFTLLSQMGQTWGGCVESRPIPYDVQDDAPTSANPATLFVPYFAPDENDGTWSSPYYGNNLSHMNNYLTDTGTDADLQSSKLKYTTTPRSGASGWGSLLGPGWGLGPNMGCATQPVTRMTTDTTVVKNAINSMIATGETHIPIGLVWGWHVLSPNAPFADGSAYSSPTVTKVAVLVTDGANTYFNGPNSGGSFNGNTGQPHNYNSSYTGYGDGWQDRLGSGQLSGSNAVGAINSRLTQLCTNMKAKGLVIYTVPVQITDSTIKSLLQSCASNPSNYIEVTTSAGMQSAFASIASSIGKLRLAH